MYHVVQRKPQWLKQNDMYRGHRIRPGNLQICKSFLLYHQLFSTVIFNTLSTMNYIAWVVELWWNYT